jgi:hypothetical protein
MNMWKGSSSVTCSIGECGRIEDVMKKDRARRGQIINIKIGFYISSYCGT